MLTKTSRNKLHKNNTKTLPKQQSKIKQVVNKRKHLQHKTHHHFTNHRYFHSSPILLGRPPGARVITEANEPNAFIRSNNDNQNKVVDVDEVGKSTTKKTKTTTKSKLSNKKVKSSSTYDDPNNTPNGTIQSLPQEQQENITTIDENNNNKKKTTKRIKIDPLAPAPPPLPPFTPPLTSIKQLTPQLYQIAVDYELIKSMRQKTEAPVDTIGCSETADRTAEPKVQRFETLVSLMLSAQTRDEITHNAVVNLRTKLKYKCTPKGILYEPELAHDCIKKVMYHNTKIKNLLKVSQICQDELNDDIPDSYEGLMSLPGVGPKMANLVMSSAYNKITGIAIDVHLQRILNHTLQWWGPSIINDTPDKTRIILQKILPMQYWDEINWIIVGFGQTICHARGPKCLTSCARSTLGLCNTIQGQNASIELLDKPILELIKKYQQQQQQQQQQNIINSTTNNANTNDNDNDNIIKIGTIIQLSSNNHEFHNLIKVDKYIIKLLQQHITSDNGNNNNSNTDTNDHTTQLLIDLKQYISKQTLKKIWKIDDQTVINFWKVAENPPLQVPPRDDISSLSSPLMKM